MLDGLDQAAVIQRAQQIVEQTVLQRMAQRQVVARRLDEARRVYAAWLQRLDRHFAQPDQNLYSEATLARKVRQAEAAATALEQEWAAIEAAEEAAAAQLPRLRQFLADTHQWWRHFLEARESLVATYPGPHRGGA
jgi:hypothetical protein